MHHLARPERVRLAAVYSPNLRERGCNPPFSWAVDRLCGILTAREDAYTEQIHRSKLNINMPAPHIPEGGHFMPHRDMEGTPHTVALYYPIDSDGDTVFFTEDGDTLKEFYRVTPKADTLVWFDGSLLHAAEPPRNTPCAFPST